MMRKHTAKHLTEALYTVSESNNVLDAVYNALTHWSTHTDAEWERQNDKGIFVILKTSRGSSNPDLVATRRQDAVRDVLQSKEWKKLYRTN